MTDAYVQSSHAHNSTVYHTEQCRAFPDRYTTTTVEKAKNRGLKSCDVCSGDYEPHKESDPWKYHKKAEEIANG